MARCARCLSFERTRLLWLVLCRTNVLKPGLRVLHAAPERGLLVRLHLLYGDSYEPCDLNPGLWSNEFRMVTKLNLCGDLAGLPSDAYDLIIHNHVLEHLPCAVEPVLRELTRILRPGGHHFFTAPIAGRHTIEDLSDSLSKEERTRRLGQHDHVRLFGADDLLESLRRIWETDAVYVEPLDLFSVEELRNAAVPIRPRGRITGETVFHQRKPLAS